MATYDKYGRLINPKFRSQPVTGFGPAYHSALRRRSYNTWGRINDFITDIGDWLDDNGEALANNLSFFFYAGVWVLLAVAVIVQLFTSFWSALLIAAIGGVIVYYAATIGMVILMYVLRVFFYVARYIFYNVYTLLLSIVIIAGICFTNRINMPDDMETHVSAPSPPLQPNYYCNVNTALNVREHPRPDAPIIGQLKRNEGVYVYSIDGNNFAKIDFKGRIAYASAGYLNPKEVSAAAGSASQTVSARNTEEAGIKIGDLIGRNFTGYDDRRALQDKLGFWCGNQLGYGDGRFDIERWENKKAQKLWLVLVEKNGGSSESVIRDILPFERKSVGDIGTFPVYNKDTKQWSDYMMVQVSANNELVKIYDVDLQNGKIIAVNPEACWGEVRTEWDSY
ncbi:MAG: SH3 domain-containing protein [Tannerella sp.]|nr:SH3 domain-containing protein [Tannerella sp.]